MINRAQILTPPSREALADTISKMPDGDVGYFKPLLEAMHDHDIQVAVVPQGNGPFELCLERPAVIVLQDSPESLGPAGFDVLSVKTFLFEVKNVIVISSQPTAAAYLTAAFQPVRCGVNCLVIETTPAHEADWISLVRGVRPSVPMLIFNADGCSPCEAGPMPDVAHSVGATA
jgi:hypothetical protein